MDNSSQNQIDQIREDDSESDRINSIRHENTMNAKMENDKIESIQTSPQQQEKNGDLNGHHDYASVAHEDVEMQPIENNLQQFTNPIEKIQIKQEIDHSIHSSPIAAKDPIENHDSIATHTSNSLSQNSNQSIDPLQKSKKDELNSESNSTPIALPSISSDDPTPSHDNHNNGIYSTNQNNGDAITNDTTISQSAEASGSRSSSTNSSPTKSLNNGVIGSRRTKRPEPVFISSRNFAPLPSDPPAPSSQSGSKRAERKSKTDALSAMNGMDYGGGGGGGRLDINAPTPSQHPSHKPLDPLTSTFEPLPLFGRIGEEGGEGSNSSFKLKELNSVPTHHNTPRYPPPRQRKRLFELEEAPTFYPSIEEFSDPLKYIKWVGEPEGGNGKSYGIVKIVPPVGWNPPFVLDQERFRFRTRVQRLNSLSADARASLNYLEQLQKFHAQQGQARVSIPIVDRKPVDLYQLKLIVASYGGYDFVARNRKWAEVTRKVGYEEKESGHLAGQIKAAYSRIIYPFERFIELNKENSIKKSSNDDPNAPSSPVDTGLDDEDTSMADNNDTSMATTSEGVSTRRRSSRRKTDPTDTPVVLSQRKRLRQQQPTPPPAGTSGDFYLAPGAEEQMCEICLRGDDGMSMLLCDECNRGFHMYCLDPPLTSIPKSEWYCPPCLVGTGNDYGFDDGETHSLSSFWKRAEAFRSEWWSKHASEDSIWTDPNGEPNGVTRTVSGTDFQVSEDDVEREFWRLVHSPDETVEVEYGADVHSTTHGSALPTLETCPLSPYSRDGWNLNNLPILNGSLLRYIKSDISGMTVPWVYVGMMFSTFCWHNEDHYTYSINYQHFGDTKTWYGVPGSDAYKLEDALRKAAPDLFEQSPDLLFQLVTMMSPDKLQKEGVNVYAVDQRANEFVITYPKAYHSGFNQGFNLNEAVNFALPDWIDLDLECVKRYQKFNRFPVFSHDELVATVFQHNQSVETAIWLQNPMREMVEREIEMREKVRNTFPGIQEIVEDVDQAESEYQCIHCNVFCYLGQIYSKKSEGIACLEHGNQVCGMDATTKWTLRLRYSDEELQSMLEKTIERAAVPSNWQAKLHKLITNHARPPLRSLRGLLHEGEKISFSLDDLNNLKEFVEKANKWIDEATPLIARRHQRRSGVGNSTKESITSSRRSKRPSKGAKNEEDESMNSANDDVENVNLATADDVFRMVQEAERLPFDSPEIQSLQTVAEQINDFTSDAESLLKRLSLLQDENVEGEEEERLKERKDILGDCEDLIVSGSTLNVQLPFMEELRRLVGKDKWTKEAATLMNTYTDLDEVELFISEGESFGITKEDKFMRKLCEIRDEGVNWKQKAEKMLLYVTPDTKWPCKYSLDDLEAAVSAPVSTSIVPELLLKLQQLLKQVEDVSKSINSIFEDMEEGRKELDDAKKSGQFLTIDPLWSGFIDGGRQILINSTNNVATDKEEELKELVLDYSSMDKAINKWLLYTRGKDRNTSNLAGKLTVLREDERRLKKIGTPRKPNEICICRSEEEEFTETKMIECKECHCTYHTECLRLNSKNVTSWICPFCDPERLHGLVRRHESLSSLSTLIDQVKLPQETPKLISIYGEMEMYKYIVSIRDKANLFEETVEKSELSRPKNEAELKRYVDLLKDAMSIEWCNIRLSRERVSLSLFCAQVIYAYKGKDSNGSLIVAKVGPEDPRFRRLAATTESQDDGAKARNFSSLYTSRGWERTDARDYERYGTNSESHPIGDSPRMSTATSIHNNPEERAYQYPPSMHSHSRTYGSMSNAPFSSSPYMHAEDSRSMSSQRNLMQHPMHQSSSVGPEDVHRMQYRARDSLQFSPPSESKRSLPPSMGFGRPPPPSGPSIGYDDMNNEMGQPFGAQPMFEASPQANGSGDESYGGIGKDKKRKRGKRARFVFEEEVGIFVPVNGERIFCLCRKGETGNMISCDRCSLWFHTACVHVNSVADLGGERWICPMCCVKTERRYPFAEVKVKEMNVDDPHLWLDVRATLRSTKSPYSKLQHWTVDEDRRIVLHLESFLPATLPSKSDRQRSDEGDGSNGKGHRRSGSQGSTGSNSAMANALGSVSKMPSWNDVRARVTPIHRTPNAEENAARQRRLAEERHQQGMKNLYSRGVSDSMIQKWFIGWNGKELVYPRYDRMGIYHELPLGSKVSLAKDDPDGSKFMQIMLDREAEERRSRGEPPIIAAPPSTAGPAPPPSAANRPPPPPPPPSLPQSKSISSQYVQPEPVSISNVSSHNMTNERSQVPTKSVTTSINSNLNIDPRSNGQIDGPTTKVNPSLRDQDKSESPTPSKPVMKKTIYSVTAIPPFRGTKSSSASDASVTPPAAAAVRESKSDIRGGEGVKRFASGTGEQPVPRMIEGNVMKEVNRPPPLPQINGPRSSNPNVVQSGVKRDAQGRPINSSVSISKPFVGTMRNMIEPESVRGNSRFEPYARSNGQQNLNVDEGGRSVRYDDRSGYSKQPPSSSPRQDRFSNNVHGTAPPPPPPPNRSSPYTPLRQLPPPPTQNSFMSSRRGDGEDVGHYSSSFSPSPHHSKPVSIPSPSLPPISPRFNARGPSSNIPRSSFTSSPQNQYGSPLSPREYGREYNSNSRGQNRQHYNNHHHHHQQYQQNDRQPSRISPPPLSARQSLGLQQSQNMMNSMEMARDSYMSRSSISPRLSNRTSFNGGADGTTQSSSLPPQPPPPYHSSSSSSSSPKEQSMEDFRQLARRMKPNATDEEIEEMVRHAIS